MKVYSVGCTFGTGNVYSFLTYEPDIQIGDDVVVQLETGKLKLVKVAAPPSETVPEEATAWVVAHVDMKVHLHILQQIESEDAANEPA